MEPLAESGVWRLPEIDGNMNYISLDNLRQNRFRLMSGSLGLKMGNAEQSSYFSGDMKGGCFHQSLLLQCAFGGRSRLRSPGKFYASVAIPF